MDKKVKQIVASVVCFLLSFAIAMFASWLLRNGPCWYALVVLLWTIVLVIALLGMSIHFAGEAFGKGKN
jgi:hypothetical protein